MAAGIAKRKTAPRAALSTPRSASSKGCWNSSALRAARPPAGRAPRERGQEYLLARRLFRRLSTGEAIEQDRKGGPAWMQFSYPAGWRYDILRALDYLRGAGPTQARGNGNPRTQARPRRPLGAGNVAPGGAGRRAGRGRRLPEPME